MCEHGVYAQLTRRLLPCLLLLIIILHPLSIRLGPPLPAAPHHHPALISEVHE